MRKTFVLVLILILAGWIVWKFNQAHTYQKIIERLKAETRAAEVLVTAVNYDEKTKRDWTTIKFVEYDTTGNPLAPRYFTFSGNLIQFQSLVVRFQDKFVSAGDLLRGKSVYLFWKAFFLDGKNTQEFPITEVNAIPGGYKIPGKAGLFENLFWKDFWRYAFDQERADKYGIKSVQIEAPGTVFIPGYVYTIHIEHDGGLRIDAKPVDPVLKGEKILN